MYFWSEWKNGIFPSYKSIGEARELEEERRLCYVGLTRAEEYLYLTCSKQRTIFGATSCNKMSRFIDEMPKDLLDGYDNIKGKSNFEERETTYNWEYGTSKKMQTKEFDDKFSQNKQEFKFRTAESFLNSINKVKEESEQIDLSIYKTGLKVHHKKFGDGIITAVEKEGEDLKVDIDFEKSGHKRLMAKFANLEII